MKTQLVHTQIPRFLSPINHLVPYNWQLRPYQHIPVPVELLHAQIRQFFFSLDLCDFPPMLRHQ